MFKKFEKTDISGQSQLKSSVQRGIRTRIQELYPQIEPDLDEILPKKSPMTLVKCPERIQIISIDGQFRFFNQFDGPWMPTLELLHLYPNMMTKLQVDKGAIKFVLSGANIMCPGLTSPGARMEMDVGEGQCVAITAEGKEHAVAIGITKMSTEDIRTKNKGIAVETVHNLGDALWKFLRQPEKQ